MALFFGPGSYVEVRQEVASSTAENSDTPQVSVTTRKVGAATPDKLKLQCIDQVLLKNVMYDS